MDILLDTHAAIWFFAGDERLAKTAMNVMQSLDNALYVSIASVWELGIKMSAGKLGFIGGIDGFVKAIENNGFSLIAIEPEHIKAVVELPFVHRDPFDRILIAQAMVENMTILTLDANIGKYDVRTVW